MTQNKFDEKAYTFDAKPMHVERSACVANAISEKIGSGQKEYLADFGCGTGLLGFQMKGQFSKIDMIDTSTEMLSVVRDKIEAMKLKEVTALPLDIFQDQIPNARYDVIATLMAFHHIENLGFTLCAFKKMLKPEGYICIADLDEEDGSYHQDEKPYHKGINQHSLENMAYECGLKLQNKAIPYVIKKQTGKYPVFLHIYQIF